MGIIFDTNRNGNYSAIVNYGVFGTSTDDQFGRKIPDRFGVYDIYGYVRE